MAKKGKKVDPLTAAINAGIAAGLKASGKSGGKSTVLKPGTKVSGKAGVGARGTANVSHGENSTPTPRTSKDRVATAVKVITSTPAPASKGPFKWAVKEPKKKKGKRYTPPRFVDPLPTRGKDGKLHYPKGSGSLIEAATTTQLRRLLSPNQSLKSKDYALKQLQLRGKLPGDDILAELANPKPPKKEKKDGGVKGFIKENSKEIALATPVVGPTLVTGTAAKKSMPYLAEAAKQIQRTLASVDDVANSQQGYSAKTKAAGIGAQRVKIGKAVQKTVESGALATGSAVLEGLMRPVSATEAALGKGALYAGLGSPELREKLKNAKGPKEAFLEGRDHHKDITGGDLTEAVGLPRQAGILADLGFDPLLWLGVAAAPATGGGSLAATIARIRAAAPELLTSPELVTAARAYNRTKDDKAYAKALQNAYVSYLKKPGNKHADINSKLAEMRANKITVKGKGGKTRNFSVPSRSGQAAVAQALRAAELRTPSSTIRLQAMLPTGRTVVRGRKLPSAPIIPGRLVDATPIGKVSKAAREKMIRDLKVKAGIDATQESRQKLAFIEAAKRDARTQGDEAKYALLSKQEREVKEGVDVRATELFDAAVKDLPRIRTLGDKLGERRAAKNAHVGVLQSSEFGRTVQASFSRALEEATKDLDKIGGLGKNAKAKTRALERVQLALFATEGQGGIGRHILEEAGIKLTPAEEKVYENYRTIYDNLLKHGQDTGILEKGVRNYAGYRVWEKIQDPEKMTEEVLRNVRGTAASFSKHRSIAAVSDYASPEELAKSLVRAGATPEAAKVAAEALHRNGRVRGIAEMVVRRLQRGETVMWNDLTNEEKRAIRFVSDNGLDDARVPLFRYPGNSEATEGQVLPNIQGWEEHYKLPIGDIDNGVGADEAAMRKLVSAHADRSQIASWLEHAADEEYDDLLALYGRASDEVARHGETLQAGERAALMERAERRARALNTLADKLEREPNYLPYNERASIKSVTKKFAPPKDTSFKYTDDQAELESRKWYHGTNAGDIKPEQIEPLANNDPRGLFGPGFYLTDSPQIGGEYALMRNRAQPLNDPAHMDWPRFQDKIDRDAHVYQLGVKLDGKVMDLEGPASDDLREAIFEVINRPRAHGEVPGDNEIVKNALERQPEFPGDETTGKRLFRAFKDDLHAHAAQNPSAGFEDYADAMHELSTELVRRGYAAFTHLGGTLMGNTKHQVLILLGTYDNDLQAAQSITRMGKGPVQQVLANAEYNSVKEALARGRADAHIDDILQRVDALRAKAMKQLADASMARLDPSGEILKLDARGNPWVMGKDGDTALPVEGMQPRSAFDTKPDEDPFDWTSRLPDARSEAGAMPDLDPRTTGYIRARAQGVSSSFQSRWMAFDEVHGRSTTEYHNRSYIDRATGEERPVTELAIQYDDTGKVVGYERADGHVYAADDVELLEPTLIPNADGTIWRDPVLNQEYVSVKELNDLGSELMIHNLPDDRVWPTQAIDDYRVASADARGVVKDLYETGMESGYGRVLSMMRFGVTTPFPAYHIRNLISDMLKSLQADTGVLFHPVVNYQLTKAAFNKGLDRQLRVRGLPNMNLEEFLFLADTVGVRTGHHAAEVMQLARSGELSESEILRIHQKYNPLYTGGPLTKFGAHREDMVRYMTFLQRLRHNGGDVADAGWYTIKHHFNYNDLSQAEKKYARNVFLFYTWYRKNIPLQLAELARRPGFFAGIASGYEALENGETPANVGPFSGAAPFQPAIADYVRDRNQAATMNWNGYAVNVAFGAPWSDLGLASTKGVGELFSMVNPLLQAGGQAVYSQLSGNNGLDPLTGRQYKDREPGAMVDVADMAYHAVTGQHLSKNAEGQYILPWWETYLLRSVPFLGRGTYNLTAPKATAPDIPIQTWGRRLSNITGLGVTVSPKPGSAQEKLAMEKYGKGLAAERKDYLETLSKETESARQKKLDAFDKKQAEDAARRKLDLKKVKGTAPYVGKKRGRKKKSDYGLGSGGGLGSGLSLGNGLGD